MITWLTGNTGAGKTELAKFLARMNPNSIVLDGDLLREDWNNVDMSTHGRWKHNIKVAHKAAQLEIDNPDGNIIVSVICPFKMLRAEVNSICDCAFVYVKGGKVGEEYPYDVPDDSETYVKYSIDWRTK